MLNCEKCVFSSLHQKTFYFRGKIRIIENENDFSEKKNTEPLQKRKEEGERDELK
jgi:hypothetical protein